MIAFLSLKKWRQRRVPPPRQRSLRAEFRAGLANRLLTGLSHTRAIWGLAFLSWLQPDVGKPEDGGMGCYSLHYGILQDNLLLITETREANQTLALSLRLSYKYLHSNRQIFNLHDMISFVSEIPDTDGHQNDTSFTPPSSPSFIFIVPRVKRQNFFVPFLRRTNMML